MPGAKQAVCKLTGRVRVHSFIYEFNAARALPNRSIHGVYEDHFRNSFGGDEVQKGESERHHASEEHSPIPCSKKISQDTAIHVATSKPFPRGPAETQLYAAKAGGGKDSGAMADGAPAETLPPSSGSRHKIAERERE